MLLINYVILGFFLTKSSIEIDILGYIFFVLFVLFKVVDFGLIMKSNK